MSDSEARIKARDEMDRVVRRYVEIVATENGVSDHAVLVGWAGSAEYTSVELQARDEYGNCTLAPEGQSAAMSRGMMHFGADAFSRTCR